MNYNTIIAATVFVSQIQDAREQERNRIVLLLIGAGEATAVQLILESGK